MKMRDSNEIQIEGEKPISLAYLIHESPEEGYRELGRDLSLQLDEAALPLGFRVERIGLKDEIATGQLLDKLHQDGCRGIIVGPCREGEVEVLIEERRFSVVQIQRTDPLPFHTVRFSISQDIRNAWQQIRRRGYRRIGAVIPFHSPPIQDDMDRRGVILNELADLPENEQVPPFTGDFSDFAGFCTWLKNYHPDAILAFHIGFYYSLRELDIDPHTLGWAILHLNTPRMCALGFCGLAQDKEGLAEQGIRFMDQLIRHGERGITEKPVHTLVSSVWLEGRTLPGPGNKFRRLPDV